MRKSYFSVTRRGYMLIAFSKESWNKVSPFERSVDVILATDSAICFSYRQWMRYSNDSRSRNLSYEYSLLLVIKFR